LQNANAASPVNTTSGPMNLGIRCEAALGAAAGVFGAADLGSAVALVGVAMGLMRLLAFVAWEPPLPRADRHASVVRATANRGECGTTLDRRAAARHAVRTCAARSQRE